MALDFFGVTINANITVFPGDSKDESLGEAGIPFSKDGDPRSGLTYDLWLKSQSHPNVPKALRTLSYVQDISVELGMGMNSKVQLVLTPPWDDALVLLNSPLIQWGIGRLNVRFGYSTGDDSSNQSFVFGGILMKPDVKIGNDIVVTLNSVGIGYALNLAEGHEAQNFKVGDTPASVIKRVLKDYVGVSTDKIYEDFSSADQNPRTGLPFFRPIFQDTPFGPDQRALERGPRNDWWFIWETVKSYGYELLIVDRDIRVKHSEGWRKGRVKHRFRLKAGVTPSPAEGPPIFPILSLSSPTGSMWLASGVGRMVIQDIDEKKAKKKVVIVGQKTNAADKKTLLKGSKGKKRKKLTKREEGVVEAKDALKIIEEDMARTAKQASNWPTLIKGRHRTKPLAASSNFPGNPSSSLLNHARSMFRNRNHKQGIHVDVQTIGIPSLRPGVVVAIDGFAVEGQQNALFDGPYGVIEVRHKVGLGGFTTTFKAISDFIPRAFVLALGEGGSKIKPTASIPPKEEKRSNVPGKKDKISVVPK